MKNKVKPTEKQIETLKRMKGAKTLSEAMQAGGYSIKSSWSPKSNFLDREGTKVAIEEYKDLLVQAGVTPEVLAEIEAAGLFSENDMVRLGYLKEVKKTFGLTQSEQPEGLTRKLTIEEFIK